MTKSVGMTQAEKRETLAYASELLYTAEQLSRLTAMQDKIDEEVQECRKQLILEALFALGSIYQVADAEIQPGWTKDRRNPYTDPSKPTGFVPDIN